MADPVNLNYNNKMTFELPPPPPPPKRKQRQRNGEPLSPIVKQEQKAKGQLPKPPPPPKKRIKHPVSTETLEQDLSPEENTIFQKSAEYGNMTPERARMNPQLRSIWRNLRQDGLFITQVYAEGTGQPKTATYDQDKLAQAPGYIINDGLPESERNNLDQFMDIKEKMGYLESLILKPLYKSERKTITHTEETTGFFGRKKTVENKYIKRFNVPRDFSEIVKTSTVPGQAVRLTWHVSAKMDYKINEIDHRPNFIKPSNYDKTNGMFMPISTGKDKTSDITSQIDDIIHQNNVSDLAHGRPGNQLAISVVLPKERAQELLSYLEKHPDMIRPFFLSGGLDKMVLHRQPPFKKYDSDNPNRPIQIREFVNEEKFEDRSTTT